MVVVVVVVMVVVVVVVVVVVCISFVPRLLSDTSIIVCYLPLLKVFRRPRAEF